MILVYDYGEPRKHFELNSDIAKLIDKYNEINDTDFNDLVNTALRFYLVNQMSYKDIQEALKEADVETLVRSFSNVARTKKV